MKPLNQKTLNTISLTLIIICVMLVNILATTIYWQHEAVIHHGAFWEANSWGIVSFKWNDVSFAQAPFQDTKPWENMSENLFNQKLKQNGIQ